MTKSKSRIAEFGEVFTSEREVKAMLDLVEAETYRIESRFLEPACGDGNFLNEVLLRKLSIVGEKYSKVQLDYERNSFAAVASIYGIDLLQDNVKDCRTRLLTTFQNEYSRLFLCTTNQQLIMAIKWVLEKNIIHGDALTLQVAGSKTPISFSEWAFVKGSKVKQTVYSLENILAYQPFEEGSLFSDLGDEAVLHRPIGSFPAKNFWELNGE